MRPLATLPICIKTIATVLSFLWLLGAFRPLQAQPYDLVVPLISPDAPGGFGNSVAVSCNTVLIGNSAYRPAEDHFGRAYSFSFDGSLDTIFERPFDQKNAEFGYAVAANRDHIFIGAPFDNEAASAGGAVYEFDVETGVLLRTLLNPDPLSGEQFGKSLAVGDTSILIGAEFERSSGIEGGAVYEFNIAAGALTQVFQNPTPEEDDRFGHALVFFG